MTAAPLLFGDLPLPPGADAPPATCPGKAWVEKLRVFVPGQPRPGGSKTATVIRRKGGAIVMTAAGRPLVVTREAGGELTANWRANVAHFAGMAWGTREPIPRGTPIWLAVKFVMPRPAGHFGTGRRAGIVKPDAPVFHTSAPDATKLMRALEDALTGILYVDDSLIVAPWPLKVYGSPVGAEIRVMTLVDKPAPGGPVYPDDFTEEH